MTLPILLDDALLSGRTGFALRLSLPWIRSLPLASVRGLTVAIDGEQTPVRVALNGRLVEPPALADETGWWFLQDRLTLVGERMLRPGVHEIGVAFELVVPYLVAGPDGPLVLPFRAQEQRKAHADWIIGASAFNWTPEVVRGARPAEAIVMDIVRDGVASAIEVEPGQLWRSFPAPGDAEVDVFRQRLAAEGGKVTIVGASLDDWVDGRKRDTAERLAFLEGQLRAASRLGARGVRVPFGQAGRDLLQRVQPLLEQLDLVLFEEIQGQQSPDDPGVAANLDTLTGLADRRIRVLVDTSMLMPALPPSYLDRLRRGGLDAALVGRLEHEWRGPDTHASVVGALRDGRVPPPVRALFMNLLVRFGRSTVADLEPLMPLVGAVHLKFWDLDDTDGRVSQPIVDMGAALRQSGFSGILTSEWGGHDWLDDDPADMTRDHLALARSALKQHAG